MSSSVFDYAASLERMGGDPSLFGEMAGFWLADAPFWLEQLRTGLAVGDAALVHRSAHTIKGLAANFGASTVIALASRIEQYGREQALVQAQEQIPSLDLAISELSAALTPFHIPQPSDKAAR